MRGSWTRIGRAVAAGTIVVAAAGIPIAGGAVPVGALDADLAGVTAGTVIVEVANPTPSDLIGTVFLRAETADGRTLEVSVPVVVPRGESARIPVGIEAAAVEGIELGVVLDDGVPF